MGRPVQRPAGGRPDTGTRPGMSREELVFGPTRVPNRTPWTGRLLCLLRFQSISRASDPPLVCCGDSSGSSLGLEDSIGDDVAGRLTLRAMGMRSRLRHCPAVFPGCEPRLRGLQTQSVFDAYNEGARNLAACLRNLRWKPTRYGGRFASRREIMTEAKPSLVVALADNGQHGKPLKRRNRRKCAVRLSSVWTQPDYRQRPSTKTYPSWRCCQRGDTQTACSRGGTSHLPGSQA
jgi:hypothetical protein